MSQQASGGARRKKPLEKIGNKRLEDSTGRATFCRNQFDKIHGDGRKLTPLRRWIENDVQRPSNTVPSGSGNMSQDVADMGMTSKRDCNDLRQFVSRYLGNRNGDDTLSRGQHPRAPGSHLVALLRGSVRGATKRQLCALRSAEVLEIGHCILVSD